MGEVHQLRLALLVSLAVLVGCQRSGFECENDSDCFAQEQCVAGACAAADTSDACTPENDQQLCDAQAECGLLTLQDQCGSSRIVECACGPNNTCVPAEPSALCEAGSFCGTAQTDDGCGTSVEIECGLCAPGERCDEGVCASCDAPVCPPGGVCGSVSNECGETIDCGRCTGGELCFDFACVSSLRPASIDSGDRFGERVRVTSRWIGVGAPFGSTTSTGAIFVYERNDDDIRLAQVLESATETTSFSSNFAIRGDRIMVASDGQLETWEWTESTGFQRISTDPLEREVVDLAFVNDQQILLSYVPSNRTDTLYHGECGADGCRLVGSWNGDQPNEPGELGLGAEIDVADNVVLVGAPLDNVATTDDALAEGSAYFFVAGQPGSSWAPTGMPGALASYDAFDYRNFIGDEVLLKAGQAVAVTEDKAVMGAPFTSPGQQGTEAGSFYTLTSTTVRDWSVRDRFISPSDDIFARCGIEVEIVGNTLFIGCLHRGTASDNLPQVEVSRTFGEVFRFNFDDRSFDWMVDFERTLRAPSYEEYDHFGWSMEASEDLLFVGAPGRASDSGEMFFFPVQ